MISMFKNKQAVDRERWRLEHDRRNIAQENFFRGKEDGLGSKHLYAHVKSHGIYVNVSSLFW
jgi:hypothetical protein